MEINNKLIYFGKRKNMLIKAKEKKKILKFKNKFLYYHINLLITIFTIFLCKIYSSEKILLNLIKLDFNSEITITIKGNNEQNILNEVFKNNLPNETYVNGVQIENSITIKGLIDNENTIKMIWYYQLKTCREMFRGLSNIISIDFSKFDTSLVTDMSSMFYNCISLTSLDLSNFNTSSVESFLAMFFNCSSLKNLNLKNFNTSKVINMRVMFYCCSALESLDLGYFNTPSLKIMDSMFRDCSSLKYLNIENFNTSLIRNMHLLFYNCSSLTSLDVSSFNTSSVENMQGTFGQCHSLLSLDLSNFETSSVNNMEGMFGGSYSLISLDLSNFNISKVTNMLGMFFDLKSIVFLNLDLFQETNENINMQNMFKDINNNLLICLDSEINKKISSSVPLYIENNCQNECFYKNRKTIIDSKQCINDCKDSEYKYEYNRVCFIKCPDNTHLSSNNEYLCEKNINCEKKFKYYNYEQTSCIDEIPKYFFVNDTIKNTIDKCHLDCKSCSKKFTEINSNCDSCLGDKYLNLGNCVSNCDNGYFTDKFNNKICKCSSDISCKECSFESLEFNSCISCNIDYYQKIDESPNNNSFIKCYKDPDYYYLDKDIYKSCYSTCKKCSGFGDENNNNCIECKNGYILLNEKNCYINCEYYYYFDLNNKYKCTKDYNCPEQQNKLIKEKNKCINNCYNDNIYKYEFNNTCYKSCPETTSISLDNEYLCEINCPEDMPYEIENNKCTNECNATNFFKGICKINNNNPTTLDDMIKNIREQISNLTSLNATNNQQKDLLVKAKNTTYQITTTDNQNNNEYNDISTIKLGECENILKKEYQINFNKSLIIFKIDYYMPGLSIPVIGYEVYSPDGKQKLDLNKCKDILIDFDIPVSIDENNLFKYDPNNEYYIDECFPYTTDNGTDIILNDRKEEFIDNNLSLCENKCSYNGYNENSKKASCECEVKSKDFLITELINDDNILSNNLTFDNSSSNIMTMKCVYTLFSKDGLLKNIANYILIFILIAFIVLIILFYKVGYYTLGDDMNKIITFKEKKQCDVNIYTAGQKIGKKKKKKKTKKKSQNGNNPPKFKKKKIIIKVNSKKIEHKDSFKSFSKIELKNTNILANNEKSPKSNIKVYKKNNNDLNKLKNFNFIDLYDCELNSFTYSEALKYDKRTFIQYYISLLKFKHPLIFSFIPIKDYNTITIKISLFLLSFVIYFGINTFFFNNSTLHKIYLDQGVYNIRYQITKIIICFIISHIIFSIIKYFSLSEREILKVKYEIDIDNAIEKADEVKKCLIIKYTCFFILSLALLIFFWYYLSSFSAVYKNSQIYLILNTVISFGISFLYPFIINLVPCIFRIISLKNKNRKFLFIISKIFQFL